MKTFSLKIITMDGIVFSGSVSEITLTTESGQISVFADHVALLTIIKEGIITVKTEATLQKFKTSSGVIEISPEHEVYILVDSATPTV